MLKDVVNSNMFRASAPLLTRNLLILDRRDAILAIAPLLQDLALRCDQPGAMHWLPYFLDEGVTRLRKPFLVLTLRPEKDANTGLSVDDVESAALFFEYRLFGLRSGIVSTGDAVGFNSIIAPSGERARLAAAAARALVQRGAALVLCTYENAGEPEMQGVLAGWPGVHWAWRQRHVGRILQLEPTLDATLAKMGKSTRFNLRYYRRRFAKELACEYVPEAAPLLHGADLAAMNAGSLNPVTPDEFERRVRSASELPGSYLSGLRAPDGRWVSLIGGWRQGETTVLYWQMNSLGFERHSIGTVMRSYYLEHEISRGARKLLIYGGTPHSMRNSFQEEPVADLVVRRRGVRAAALGRLARFTGSPRNLFGRANFLADTLRSPDLQWRRGSTLTSGRSRSQKPAAAEDALQTGLK